jgi:hypothetical protein
MRWGKSDVAADSTGSNLHDRVVALEHLGRQHAEAIEDMGGTLDHCVNTIDSILLPTQKVHGEKIADCESITTDLHDWVTQQKGAWAFVQRFGIVVAALSSLVVMVMKILGK